MKISNSSKKSSSDSKPKRISLSLKNINEMEEHLISDFDNIEHNKTFKTIFYVDQYDEHCEDFLQIEKIITLQEDNKKLIIFIFINILTLLMINLILIRYPKLKLKFLYQESNINQATHLGIYPKNNPNDFKIVELKEISLPEITGSHLMDLSENNINPIYSYSQNFKIKTFEFKLFKYFYSQKVDNFISYKFNLKGSYLQIQKRYIKGLNLRELEYQRNLYGKCDIEIQIENLINMIVKEITDPFYIFQIFSVILWLNNEYVKYALVIIFSTIISLLIGVIETRKNLLSIREMARYSCKLNVIRNISGKVTELFLDSSELVNGDIFELPDDNIIVPCDCLLINGSVIMNESILTGESVPVVKQHMPSFTSDFDKNEKKFLIYAGTKIIQKRSKHKVMAIVIKTGFSTEKGSLIRAILFPKENQIKFKQDSISYIKIMFVLSLFGFIISFPFMLNKLTVRQIIFRALDLITTTVPPALPACIGIGISYALLRIKDKGIICINRDRVNEAGKINLICFDKTGTLTEDHLDLIGFKPIYFHRGSFIFDHFVRVNECEKIVDESFNYVKTKLNQNENENIKNQQNFIKNKTADFKSFFIECLATCHSITRVNSKLIGDPIDIKMFECTNWILTEDLENKENYNSLISTFIRPPQEKSIDEKMSNNLLDDEILENILKSHYEIGIIRIFDFSSKLQRMSVIVKNANEENYKVFCKGSPEKIKNLCKSDTIPENFYKILTNYTKKGFRVLALAFKLVKMDYMQSQKINREDVEKNLMFLGLLIVQNKLKESTKSSIKLLKAADMKMIMATGDNIMTAISVARECKLIDNEAKIYQLDLVKDSESNEDERNNIKSYGKLYWNPIDNFEDKEELSVISKKNFDQDLQITHDKHFNFKLTKEEEIFNTSKLSDTFLPEIFSYDSDIDRNLFECDYENLRSKNIYTNYKSPKIRKESSQIHIEIVGNSDKSCYNNDTIIAITGNIFEILLKLKIKYLSNMIKYEKLKPYYELFKHVLENSSIFARMSPENKTNLIESLKDLNHNVLMCGDGANDCGALRAAHVGVSLSVEEASIAAHFTSNKADITCIKTILIEGKAALVTTIQCFKYMMLYSVIQFSSVTIMIILGTYLSDNQFLMSDLFLIFPLAVLIAKTEAFPLFTVEKPVENLKSLEIIFSIVMQGVLQFLTQIFAYSILSDQSWYRTNSLDVEESEPCYENTTVYLISYLQYLITAVAFSKGKPFKKEFYRNYLLCLFLIVTFSHGYYLILFSDDFSNWLFDLVYITDSLFKLMLFFISLMNFLLSLIIEKVLVKKVAEIIKNKEYNENIGIV